MLSKKIMVNIDGMHCSHCAKRVEEGLKSINNIKSVKVNLEKKNATITYKGEINIEDIKKEIENMDFEFKGINE